MASSTWLRPRRYAEILLAGAVVLTVAMMIVPLPTWLLDVLIASNLALSVLVLVVALFVRDALSFASFPTILLLTTLYRLALNVSSVRLILLQADAGRVIRSFGEFVVQGNYVVGAVVFAVLTLIQYIVIARGGERVAEVGARFTLDAMPGKQLAIDADLRAGLDASRAAARRRQLERESQFYGAMDGAMKFVKGDAIAGIAITIVNVAGGLAIGLTMRNLDAATSLRTYGLLAIGDGLVSQIPSLLLSTAAGLVVTRVAAEEEGSALGAEIARQIFGDPRALATAAAFAALMAVVPGLPALPFALIAVVLGVAAWRTRSLPAPARPMPARQPRATAIEIHVGAALSRALEADRDWPARLAQIARLPPSAVVTDPELAADGFVVLVEGIAVTRTAGSKDALADVIVKVARDHAHALLGLQETQEELDALAARAPALVRAVVPERLALSRISMLLKALAREGLGPTHLREILEAAARDPLPSDDDALIETIRERLAPQLTESLRAGAEAVALHPLDPMLEDAIRDARGALSPELARDLVAAIRAVAGAGPFVIVTQPDVRRHLARLLLTELPAARVVSYRELEPGARIERRAVVEAV